MDVKIDGATLSTKEELFAVFAAALNFPAWFAHNLDALFDCLCDCPPATSVTLVHTDDLSAALGGRYVMTLVRVLTRAAEENENLTVCIFPQDGC